MNDVVMWGIHAGSRGEADDLFLKRGVVALGWEDLGNLLALQPDREVFKEHIRRLRPDLKPGAVPGQAGLYLRFAYEVKQGDYMLYPSKRDRLVHVGRVAGGYRYDPGLDGKYAHIRPVEWLGAFPRTKFTQGALWEIGSAISFFQVKNYAHEFLAALQGQNLPEPTVEEDESIALVAGEIEQTTRDFILKQLSQNLREHALEHFVAHLLECMGYRARVTPPSRDGGVDIVAHKDELGLEPPIIRVQVKSGEASVGRPVLSSLAGALLANDCGLFVTLGTFTKDAEAFARSKGNLCLVDRFELVDLIYQHYEKFDARYKAIIPLKRVYVPESPADED